MIVVFPRYAHFSSKRTQLFAEHQPVKDEFQD